jgi:TolB-like protein/tetratricopeptide (TPR) repeat protein
LEPKRGLFAELKRRNVLRAGAFYLAAAWLVVQIVTSVLPVFEVPITWLRWVIVALAVGFPLWLAFAWFYEVTPEGIRRESEVEPHESIARQTGHKLDRWIFVIMGLAIVLLLTDRFVMRHESGPETPAATALAAIPDIETDPSIAVLPMVNMSDDKANEYFSDGISEELLNLLAKVPKLRVIARTSSFSFKGQTLEIPEIARRLHVASVLEGSVRKSGDKVRITAQLIRASDGSHLWSETYDRTLDDIFKVQDEIAAAVVGQLKMKLLGAAPTAKPVDGRAYALFLQARAVARQGSADAFQQSIALYQQALAADASQAAAWTGLAEVYCTQTYQYLRPIDEAIRLAREAIERALAIDPGYAPALAQLAWIEIFHDRDFAAAALHLEHALALHPSSPDVLAIAAMLARRLGRYEQAIAIGRYVLARDPVSPTGWDDLGYALLYAGRRDEAFAAFRKVLQLSPGYVGVHQNLATLLAVGGDASGAMSEAQAEADAQSRQYALVAAHFALGERAKSDALFAQVIEHYGEMSAYPIAMLASMRGETDLSFQWLEKCLQRGETDLGAVPTYPTFGGMHGDPRWLPFLRRIGYAPEQLGKVEFRVTLPQ